MTPARLLAPAALVAAAIALFAVVTSGTDTTDSDSSSAPVATATPKATPRAKARATATPGGGGTYTVKPGDTPSAIADRLDIDVDDLLAANPDIDPNGLTIGDELELP